MKLELMAKYWSKLAIYAGTMLSVSLKLGSDAAMLLWLHQNLWKQVPVHDSFSTMLVSTGLLLAPLLLGLVGAEVARPDGKYLGM
jgi:hypothetical protein